MIHGNSLSVDPLKQIVFDYVICIVHSDARGSNLPLVSSKATNVDATVGTALIKLGDRPPFHPTSHSCWPSNLVFVDQRGG